MLERVWSELIGRLDGPFAFRLIIQPIVASILAIRAGLKDASEGRPPYFWSMATDLTQRRSLFQEMWKHVGKVFLVAVLIDVIYEIVVFRWVYPLQPFMVAIVLAVIPYVLIRGPVNRLASRRHPKAAAKKRDAA